MGTMIRAIDRAFSFRLFVADTTDVVKEAKRIHNTSAAATEALGNALTATLLLAADLKNKDDRLTLQMRGDGPVGLLVATADGDGHVKGYAEHADAVFEPTDGIASAVGKNGSLLLIRDHGMKEPYTAHSPLVTGKIDEDLAAYYYQTERIPTAIQVRVSLDDHGDVEKAAGYFLQAMPGVPDEELGALEDFLKEMPEITQWMESGNPPAAVMATFAAFEPEIIDSETIEYRCDCSREKVTDALQSLSREELIAMREEDEGAEVVCHFCDKKYRFDAEDLDEMIRRKMD